MTPQAAEETKRQEQFLKRLHTHVEALSEMLGKTPCANVITFGCQMNARDSEKLCGILQQAGFALTDREDADLVVFNTCTVRENADMRLFGRLGALQGHKKKNPHMRICVCGCLTQEAGAVEKIAKSYRFVNLVFGTFNLHRFAELLVTMYESDRMVVDVWKEHADIVEDLPVLRKYPFKSGVNIMFGCNRFCSYCIVPYVRGRERSRDPEDILREVRTLAEDGVKEVMLLGQNVNAYAKGASHGVTFPDLLRQVCQVDGIERVRFMSSHPYDLSDELIRVFATEQKVARHLHLALQSGSDRILKLMNRHYTKEHFLELVRKLREQAPDVAITTDLIVGFPTETDEDVAETIDAIEQAAFDNAFTFLYSKRAHTPAAEMETEPLSGEDRKRIQARFDRVLQCVQKNAKESALKQEGYVQRVLVEARNPQDESLLTGRLSNNTLVHFPGDASLIGSLADVKLDTCRGFYFLGHKV